MEETREKPEKPQHAGRKLYLVPFVVALEDGPEGYAEKVEAYWSEVADHVRNLEARFGKVSKIYHESVPIGGEEGLKLVGQINANPHRMLTRKCQRGAEFVAIEDGELLQETIDWQRCLSFVLSPAVVRQVATFYREASQKRNQFMASRLDETLQDDEVALLIIGQNHAVQFPPDIQVFYVSPPSLDAIQRLLREQISRERPSD